MKENKKVISRAKVWRVLNKINKIYCWRPHNDGSVCGYCEPCRIIRDIKEDLK